ncbi:MAG: HAMP domain-containing protein [Thermoanaerobaculaceae bacterium]|nr:HAMP domain-containing protein [Thermoanaerobaculaceae bacterium]MDI9621023.1 ATP-binding protein [Acidobacteriota bacterium]NLH12664.1 HAMP domain-containing protein [Holophagae bacterium]
MRIPLLAAMVSLASLALVAVITRAVLHRVTYDQIDEELDTLVEAIGSDIELRGLQDLRQDALREGLESNIFEFRLEHHSAILFRGAEVLGRTGDLPQLVEAPHLAELSGRGSAPYTAHEDFTGRKQLCRFQVARLAGLADGATLVVFRSIDGTLRALASFDRALCALSIAGALLSGLISVLAVRQALVPVERITEAAREIGAFDLSRRVPAAHGTEEFARLASVINGLLGRLERAFIVQRHLTADAAHELKTPVAVIMAEAQDALREDATPAQRAGSLRTVVEAARGLARGVDDLMELTRADAGVELSREAVRLEELVEDVVLTSGPFAATRGITLSWEQVQDQTVMGDRQGLARMLANLVLNASQYAPPGTIVEVASGSGDGLAWLEVRDRGPGVPEGDRERVFERFVRLAGGRLSNPQGSGLGLAIVAEVARRHRGRVLVLDRQGGGAVFRVEMPVV